MVLSGAVHFPSFFNGESYIRVAVWNELESQGKEIHLVYNRLSRVEKTQTLVMMMYKQNIFLVLEISCSLLLPFIFRWYAYSLIFVR